MTFPAISATSLLQFRRHSCDLTRPVGPCRAGVSMQRHAMALKNVALPVLLIALGEFVRVMVHRSARERNLIPSQLLVLYHLQLHERSATPTQLSESLMWDLSRVTKQVQSLVRKGHVEASASSGDKRCRPYALTTTGTELVTPFVDILREIERALQPLISVRTEDSMRRLRGLLYEASKLCDSGSVSSLRSAADSGAIKQARRRRRWSAYG